MVTIVSQSNLIQDNKNIKIIILIVALLLSMGVVLLLGNRIYNLLARAGGVGTPSNVQITQISSNSALVTFSTSGKTQALIEYGTNPTNLTLFASDTGDTTDHSISLSLLTPNTTYYFHVKIGGNVYDNSGLPWSFSTAGSINVPSPTIVIPTKGGSGAASTGAKVACSDVAKRMGAVKGSANYDAKYDINHDGIINSADMALCSK